MANKRKKRTPVKRRPFVARQPALRNEATIADDTPLRQSQKNSLGQIRGSFWRKVDLTTAWLIIGYGICRWLLNVPDLNRIPNAIRTVIGTGLFFAATTHF